MSKLFYPHNTFTFCSAAKINKIDPENAFDRLKEEFSKGNVTYPRSDGTTHMPIEILNPFRVNKEIIKIMQTKPLYEKDDGYIYGDVYTLTGALFLSTPASLIEDIKKAEKITPPKKINPYIGLKRKEFFENEALYIDINNVKGFETLNVLFKREIAENKTKIPAYSEEKFRTKNTKAFTIKAS
jgi:hypothetical protein